MSIAAAWHALLAGTVVAMCSPRAAVLSLRAPNSENVVVAAWSLQKFLNDHFKMVSELLNRVRPYGLEGLKGAPACAY